MLTFGLTIVRHGETQWNKDGLLQGQAIDSPLSEIGMGQAEAAGSYLKDLSFTNVFVSSMLRARQTAEIIVKHNSSCSGMEMVSDPLLRERSFGIAEGGRVEDMRNMAKAAGQTMTDFTPPEGETQDQVKDRFKAFLDKMFQRMMADHGGKSAMANETNGGPLEQLGGPADGLWGVPFHALLVGHGAYIRVMVRHLVEDLHCALPPGADKAQVLSLCPNTGIGRFLFTLAPDGAVSDVRLVFVHRRDHIQD